MFYPDLHHLPEITCFSVCFFCVHHRGIRRLHHPFGCWPGYRLSTVTTAYLSPTNNYPFFVFLNYCKICVYLGEFSFFLKFVSGHASAGEFQQAGLRNLVYIPPRIQVPNQVLMIITKTQLKVDGHFSCTLCRALKSNQLVASC